MDPADLDDPFPDRCDCHVCRTLRSVLGANLEATHDRRTVTPLLLTYGQAAELLGTGEDAVRKLVAENELRAVTVQTYGRRRIPRVEIDEYVSRLIAGQLRAWVETRRDLDQWGLRYMGDERSYTQRTGRTMTRVVGWHLGDGKATLCGKTPVGRWQVTTSFWSWTRLCADCELIRDRIRVEKLERRKRPPLVPREVRPMLTVAKHADGSESVRRVGWHLGDGTTTLCGVRRADWRLPDRRPKARPCRICQEVTGVEEPRPKHDDAWKVPPIVGR